MKNKDRVLLQHSSGLMRFVPSVQTSLALKHQQPALLNVRFLSLTARGCDTTFAHPHFPVWGNLNYCFSTKCEHCLAYEMVQFTMLLQHMSIRV